MYWCWLCCEVDRVLKVLSSFGQIGHVVFLLCYHVRSMPSSVLAMEFTFRPLQTIQLSYSSYSACKTETNSLPQCTVSSNFIHVMPASYLFSRCRHTKASLSWSCGNVVLSFPLMNVSELCLRRWPTGLVAACFGKEYTQLCVSGTLLCLFRWRYRVKGNQRCIYLYIWGGSAAVCLYR